VTQCGGINKYFCDTVSGLCALEALLSLKPRRSKPRSGVALYHTTVIK